VYHLAALAMACSALGDRDRAARLYELLLPYADGNVLVARLPSAPWARPPSTSACWPRPCRAGTRRRPTSPRPCGPTRAWARPRWRPAAAPAWPRPSGPSRAPPPRPRCTPRAGTAGPSWSPGRPRR
jgi:hypothetical protein